MTPPDPRLVGFLCDACAYAAADRAGAAHEPLPDGYRVVRVPCTGALDPELVLAAFAGGADGVLLLGCHLGECHHGGNRVALVRHRLLLKTLEALGVAPERCRFDFVGAGEPARYVALVRAFAESCVVRPRG